MSAAVVGLDLPSCLARQEADLQDRALLQTLLLAVEVGALQASTSMKPQGGSDGEWHVTGRG